MNEGENMEPGVVAKVEYVKVDAETLKVVQTIEQDPIINEEIFTIEKLDIMDKDLDSDATALKDHIEKETQRIKEERERILNLRKKLS